MHTDGWWPWEVVISGVPSILPLLSGTEMMIGEWRSFCGGGSGGGVVFDNVLDA